MNKQKRWRLGTAILILILLSTAWGCGPTPTPTLEPTEPQEEAPSVEEPTAVPEEPTVTPDIQAQCEEETRDGRDKQAEVPDGLEVSPYKDLMYVPGQVIVSGPPGEVPRIAGELGLEGPLDDTLELGEAGVAELYAIQGGTSVEEILCQIDKKAEELEVDVVGDPNYYLSPAGEWAGGASPWTQNGDWIGEIPGGGRAIAGADAFKAQWALGLQSGIGLYDANGDRIPEADGAGVRVGIFDTSPFGDIAAEGDTLPIDLEALMSNKGVVLSDAHQSWSPVVWHPPLPEIEDLNCPSRTNVYTNKAREVPDISSHGLFIAGLVHAVAPASEIHLVRVLEDEGCGSLFSIGKEVQAFMRQAQDDNIQNIVLNLSLGVHQPRNAEEFALPEEVGFLEQMLLQAHEQGAVIVAAAGNDSYAEPADAPRGMELPAAYDFVIGVAASNIDHERGCFSNFRPEAPNVAAPGGDGEGDCELPQCDEDNPDSCLVSLSYRSSPEDNYTGYVYWVGTSFAAPLVTGQVALNLPLTPTCAWLGSDLPGIIYLPSPCPTASP